MLSYILKKIVDTNAITIDELRYECKKLIYLKDTFSNTFHCLKENFSNRITCQRVLKDALGIRKLIRHALSFKLQKWSNSRGTQWGTSKAFNYRLKTYLMRIISLHHGLYSIN